MKIFNQGLLASLALVLVVTACSLNPGPAGTGTDKPAVSTEQSDASRTPAPATSTMEPAASFTASPTDIPSTPTTVPTPALPSGTLTLTGQYGYGTGFPFSPFGIQLSEDGQRLVAVTTAGIYVFNAADLSLLFEIPEPVSATFFPYNDNIAISQDGNLAVVISYSPDDYSLLYRLWDLTTGTLIGEQGVENAEQPDYFLYAGLDISPDNNRIVILYIDGTLWVIDLSNGNVEAVNEDYVNNTQSPFWVLFDPAGKHVHYLFQDIGGSVQAVTLDGVSLQEASFAATEKHNFPWTRGAFSPILSSTHFQFGYFTSGGSKTIAAFDYSTLGPRFEIKRTDPVSAMAFSPDGGKVVMAGIEPYQLEIWKVDTLKEPEESFDIPGRVWTVAVASGGEFAYGITDDGVLGMWQRGQEEPIHTVSGFLPIAFRIEYLEDGSGLRFYTENEVKAFEFIPADGKLIRLDSAPYFQKEMKDKVIDNIAFTLDKSLMAVTYLSSYDKDIRLFDLENGKFLRKIPSNIPLDFLDFTPDGKSLVVYGYSDGPIIRNIDLESGKILSHVPVNEKHGGYSVEVLLSSDKSTMAVLGQMGVMDIYDTETFEILQSLELDINQEFISDFTFTHDGSQMAIFSANNSTGDLLLNLWDLQSNEMIPAGDFNAYLLGAGPKTMVFSPDDSQLAVATEHGQILLFDMAP